MTTDLDTRLQMMGGALRHSVGDTPPRRTRPPGRARVVIGVPLVAVAALAAVLAVRDGDSVDVSPAPVVSLRGLIPETPPEGLELSWAGQQATQVGATPEGDIAGAGGAVNDIAAGPVDLSTYLYGDASGAAPFAVDDLVVNVWETAPEVPAYDAAAAAAALPGSVVETVQGQPALACDLVTCAAQAVPAVSSVRWQTEQGIQAVAASQSLTVEELLQLAEGLSIDGTAVALGTVPSTVDGALDEVAHLEDAVVDGARQVDAYWIGYVDAVDPTRALDVTTLSGSTDELEALVWSLGATEVVDLRGVDAYFAVDEAGDAVELVWQEADGVLAHVTAVGMTRDEVVALAQGLRWVADGEWQQVEELAAATQAAVASATTLPVSGDAQANAEVGVGDTGVEAEASGDGVGVGLDTAIADLEATLHTDLGEAAVIGPIVEAVEDGAEDLQDQLPPPPTTAPHPTLPGLP
jgi:hypothetical protein